MNQLSKTTAALALSNLRGFFPLMGDSARWLRVQICREINGEKTPARLCGYHAAKSALMHAYGLTTLADQNERELIRRIEAQLAQ